jgi:4-amino-4-deoxy-L-arabinose transferase-like glycosyltransferase
MSFGRCVTALSGVRHIQWYIAASALMLSVAFTFLLYPAIAGSQNLILDSDNHGPLGFGIWKHHTFSYYPNTEPASDRGPLYPFFLAALLAVSNGWWPYSAQLGQCIVFGLLCILVFRMAEALWNRSLAVLAAALCAVHPFLIWYTSRIWVETVAIFLFTALLGSIIYLQQRPSLPRAMLVGLLLGLSVLLKSIYVPFLVVVPMLLVVRRMRLSYVASIFAIGVLIVLPWIVRNGIVTGRFAPVVGRSGFTLHQGNDFVEDFGKAPFSIDKLYDLSIARMAEEAVTLPKGITGLKRDIMIDDARGKAAVDKLKRSPAFCAKKAAYGLALFWMLGDTPKKSAVIVLMQLPLFVLFVASLIVTRRRAGMRDARWVCAALVLLYYLLHLPTIALARYSVVLTPTMLALAVGMLEPYFRVSKESNR